MSSPAQIRWRIAAVSAVTVATVAFHYGFLVPAAQQHGILHEIHGRLCYIPIILGAIWFGVRGGLATALAITLLTLPYPRFRGITDSHALIGEYTEMVFYVAIGLTAGVLIELQRRERRRGEALARELARQERLSSLGQMAAGLAHEIKNPLGSIQGASELLAGEEAADGRRRDLFDILVKESKRLGRVVDHFLGFARPRPLHLGPVDIGALVGRVAAQTEIESSRRDVRVEPRVAAGLPPIQADAEQLHQVLLNVVLNAVEASTSGGVVTVEARREPRGEVALTVADDGAGIAPADLPRVFDPFFTTRERGTGLGLSISHAIVQDHGGTISIESTPGRGTRATILLPASGGGR
ncbi:MAG: ATP-binding protein [Gemmatimonadota bacterium]|nr:ATP-binding protein [Gemmatimonadota bacterium]